MTQRVGDLLCLGVDVDDFKANCRVPLFPNQWNVWEIWVSAEDAPTKDAAVDLARDFMRHVFAKHPATVAPQVTLGPAEFVSASIGSYFSPEAGGGVLRSARATAAQRSKLAAGCPLPTLRGKDQFLVTVGFVFRGSETDWPWPTLGSKPESVFGDASVTGWCPMDAVATLERAMAPVPGERVPDQGGVWRNVKDEFPDFSEGTEIALEAVKDFAVGVTSRTMFFVLGALGGAFLLWKVSQK